MLPFDQSTACPSFVGTYFAATRRIQRLSIID